MAHDDTQLFCSGLCSVCTVPGDFLRRSVEGWICDSCYSKRNITMATKKTNNPTTITDDHSLEIYSWCPKRVLWDALYNIAEGEAHEEKMRSIIGLCNDEGTWFGKKVLKHFGASKPEPVKEHPIEVVDQEGGDEPGDERFTDEIPVTVVAKAASVEGPSKPKKAPKKNAAAKKARSKQTSSKK